MATIRPRQGFPRFNLDGVNSTWNDEIIIDDASEDQVIFLLAATPTRTVGDIVLANRTINVSPHGKTSKRSWIAKLNYKHVSATKSAQQDQPANTGDENLSFSFGPLPVFFTEAITQEKFDAVETIVGPAPDVGTAINVKYAASGIGDVEGIQVPTSGDGFQIVTRQSLGTNALQVNNQVRALARLRNKKNATAFRGLNPGECLFLGFSGQLRTDGDFDMTYDFGVSIEEDFTASPFIAGDSTFVIGRVVKGFEVVWIMYQPVEDTENMQMLPSAVGLYVADVFEDGDFGQIGVIT